MATKLTPAEKELGEVWGLAQAAMATAATVERIVDDGPLAQLLRRMRGDAEEMADRCKRTAGALDGRTSAVTRRAREAKRRASEASKAYLEGERDGLAGLEFVVMAEAGELGHWRVLRELNGRAGSRQIRDLVAHALPVQETHCKMAEDASIELARRVAAEG
jgi:hypothetical protein